VVCSDLSVFREVAGAAAEYVSANDTAAWVESLLRLESDVERRAELGRSGLERAASFGWERAARETLEVWRRASGRVGASAREVGGASVRGGVSQADPT
jgi:glycosyltransferase involved in cell wall biosynthesis